jgi:hypothetical protein
MVFLLLLIWINCSFNDNTAGIEVGNPNEDKTVISMVMEVDTITESPGWFPKRNSSVAQDSDNIHIAQFELNFHQLELSLDSNPDAPDIKLINIAFPGEPIDFLNDGILEDTLDMKVHPDSDWVYLQYEFYYPEDNQIPLGSLNYRTFNARGVIKGSKGPYDFLVALPEMTLDTVTGNASPELRFIYYKEQLLKTQTPDGYNIKLIFYARYWLEPYDFMVADADVDVNGDTVYIFSSSRNMDIHTQMLERFKNSFSEDYDTLGH